MQVTAIGSIDPNAVYLAATNSLDVLSVGIGAISRSMALLSTLDERVTAIRDDLSMIFSTLAELSDAVAVMNDLAEAASAARKGK